MNEFNYEGWVYGNISESAPADSSSAGHAGQIAIDSDYIYVCVDTDTWKRAALSDF